MIGAPVYVDARAMLALLQRDDPDHFTAKIMLDMSLETRGALVSTNYEIVKASLLLRERHGIAGLESLLSFLAPLLRVQWCSAQEHEAAVEMLLVSPDTEQDLVTSLGHLVMRRRDLLPLLR